MRHGGPSPATEPLGGSSVSVQQASNILSSAQLAALVKPSGKEEPSVNSTTENDRAMFLDIPVTIHAADGVSSRTFMLRLLSTLTSSPIRFELASPEVSSDIIGVSLFTTCMYSQHVTDCLEPLQGDGDDAIEPILYDVLDDRNNSWTLSLLNSCSSCPSGTFSASPNSESCQLCMPGEFQPLARSSRCELCPFGTFTFSRGSPVCR